MTQLQICRIEFEFDRKHTANQWWQAKLPSAEGEIIIAEEKYWDEYFNGSVIFESIPFISEIYDLVRGANKLEIQSKKLKKEAHSRLISRLANDGWEPSAFDDGGFITFMKRENP